MEAATASSGQDVLVTGPDGETHRGRVLNTYQSTGGFVSFWIDLCGDFSANPANQAASDWVSPKLVLTVRDGVYQDLWQQRWNLRVLKGG